MNPSNQKSSPGGKKPKRDLMSHLQAQPPAGSTAAVTPPFADEALPLKHELPALPPAPRIEYVVFSTRLTVANDLALSRASFYLPGMSKQQLLNDALTHYLARFPEAEKLLPNEKHNPGF